MGHPRNRFSQSQWICLDVHVENQIGNFPMVDVHNHSILSLVGLKEVKAKQFYIVRKRLDPCKTFQEFTLDLYHESSKWKMSV